jgi:hypothetical protein
MSHIVSIKTEVRDHLAVVAACRRLKLADPIHGTAILFASEVAGLLVQLPDWHYPVVCNTRSGEVHYDNYAGAWGDPRHLDRFLQGYAVEKAALEARKKGHSVIEQSLADGSIKLTVQIGGAL